MNLPLLTGILFSVYFTFSYAIQCNSGWVPAGLKCYQILTIPTYKNVNDACKTYATEFPHKLSDNLGFGEKLWIKNQSVITVIDLTDKSAKLGSNGQYYSLCEESPINATIELYRNVAFDEGNWLIPNSKMVIDEMTEFLRNNSYNEFVWVGFRNNGSYYSTNGLKLNNNQMVLLNISAIMQETISLCGVFSIGTNFTFRNCSDCRSGVGISNTIASKANTTSMCLSATTEEPSTYLTTIETTELTTEISSPMTTEINTPDHLTTVTEDLMTTPDQLTTVTQNSSTTRRPKNNSTKRCFCACNKTLSPAEFMESIKDIKVKNTEVSKYIRSKTSAPDERTSSRAIGMVAVVIMVIPFGLIFLSDLPVIIQPLINYWKQKKASKNVIP